MPVLTGRGLVVATLLVTGLFAGCVAPGTRGFNHVADQHGLTSHVTEGRGFRHRTFVNGPARSGVGGRLHVYLDGDGIPWRGLGRPALDPTPRNPMVLRLMASDAAPAIYLGRPCYLGVFDNARCNPWIWTHGRYSEAVVDSMVAALQAETQRLGADELILVGYSGGGALAMLIASRLASVVGVVTLAANLDLRAWTDHHGYSALVGSIDPSREATLPDRVRQWHWVGEDDRQVPPFVVERGLSRQRDVLFEVLPRLDHRCCWEAVWPGLLRRVNAEAAQ